MPAEFPEPEDIFDRATAAEHRARIDAAKQDHAAFQKHEAEQAALRKESARQLSMRANASLLLAEYRAAGVAPPLTNVEGVPTVSLGMLAQMGWSIARLGDEAVLLRPNGDRA